MGPSRNVQITPKMVAMQFMPNNREVPLAEYIHAYCIYPCIHTKGIPAQDNVKLF